VVQQAGLDQWWGTNLDEGGHAGGHRRERLGDAGAGLTPPPPDGWS
jgi:hypothetical protein